MSKSLASVCHIDFDQWSHLAKNDPDSFEQLRQRLVDACITRAPEAQQVRLRRLQWRIDRVREQASNPMAACVKISGMMWDTFSQLKVAYDCIESAQVNNRQSVQLPSARIIPFKQH